jgi:hypothetical protein
MASLARVRSLWTGAAGLPGYTNLYFSDIETSNPPLGDIAAFWTALANYIPTDISIQVEGSGLIIEDSDGEAFGSWSTTAPAAVGATGVGAYSAPAGAGITWNTGSFADGREVRGRTYIVPTTTNAFESNGSLISAFIAAADAAAEALITASAGRFKIWHRPVKNDLGVVTRAGSQHEVTSAVVADKSYVLTSRRD